MDGTDVILVMQMEQLVEIQFLSLLLLTHFVWGFGGLHHKTAVVQTFI